MVDRVSESLQVVSDLFDTNPAFFRRHFGQTSLQEETEETQQ